MITTIEFKQGFIYKGVRHAWKKGKLYRLPFERNKRTFGLKEIPYGGGQEIHVGTFGSIEEAISAGKALT